MPNIKVGADFNEAISATVALNAVINEQGKQISEVTLQMNKYNALGKLVQSVTKGMTEDGKKFNAVLKEQLVLVTAAGNGQKAVYKKELLPSTLAFTEVKKQAKDFGKEMDEVNKTVKDFGNLKFDSNGNQIKEATNKMGFLEGATNKVIKAFGFFLTYKAFNFVTNQIEDSVAAANKLQIQLSLIRTISQDNQTAFGQLQNQVLQSSNRSGFNANDTAQAFYDTVSNQVAKGGEKVKQFVDTASDLARVTGSTLPDAGNTLTSVINAYGKSAEDAERISAVLFRTVDEGRIILSETAGTLGRAAVLGSNLGVSFEELSATLAITTQKGFKTADAMTLITNLLIKLEKPTEETKKLFEELGVSTGEEAIRLFGFTGVLQKMVDLTKSGKVSASAFFDEIRGRKQFAVFEQSIGDIDKFKDKLQDLNATQAQFNRAKDIRGESNADQLNKQLNQLKNFFTESVGSKVIAFANSVLKFGDAALTATEASGGLELSLTALGVAIGTVALAMGAAILTTTQFGTVIGASSAIFLRNIGPIAAGAAVLFAAYQAAQLGFTIGDKIVAARGGAPTAQASLEEQARFIERLTELRNQEAEAKSRPAGVSQQEFISSESFRQALGFFAQLTISNKKLFDDIKARSEEAGSALKIGFSNFADVLKDKISNLKKAITDARGEIERSQKAALKFGDSIQEAKFNLREKFAEDKLGGLNSQKIKLYDERITALKAKIESLYKLGDQASIAEARALQGQLVQARTAKEEAIQAEKQRQFDAHPNSNPVRGADGKYYRVRPVDLGDFESDLDAYDKRFKELEAGVQKGQEKTIANSKKQIEVEEQRLKRFEEASKKYQDLTPYDKEGKIKKEFETRGEFDPKKFNAEEARLRANVQKEIFSDKSPLANTGEDYRFKAAEVLFDFQKARILELGALERQVFFDNQKAKIGALETQYKEDIKKQQDLRKTASEQQQKSAQAISDALKFGGDLENSQRQALEPKNFLGRQDDLGLTKDAKYLLGEAAKRREEANAAIAKLQRNQTRDDKGGLVTRPEDYLEAKTAADLYIESLRRLYNLQKAETGQQGLPSVNGKTFGDVEDVFRKNFQNLIGGSSDVTSSGAAEQLLNDQLKKGVTDPLTKMQQQFPNVAAEAEKAGVRVNNAFQDNANKGIDSAIEKIKELQRELQKLAADGNKKVSADFGGNNAFNGGGEVYAASGGIVGMFPGQPRGVDRYPIWAAEGETIVDAQSSRMYRPMLEAIMQRRMPRYMASGGVVGHNTNVGDINVTVQGATTNDETGRSIATRLAREARRNNINLFRK